VSSRQQSCLPAGRGQPGSRARSAALRTSAGSGPLPFRHSWSRPSVSSVRRSRNRAFDNTGGLSAPSARTQSRQRDEQNAVSSRQCPPGVRIRTAAESSTSKVQNEHRELAASVTRVPAADAAARPGSIFPSPQCSPPHHLVADVTKSSRRSFAGSRRALAGRGVLLEPAPVGEVVREPAAELLGPYVRLITRSHSLGQRQPNHYGAFLALATGCAARGASPACRRIPSSPSVDLSLPADDAVAAAGPASARLGLKRIGRPRNVRAGEDPAAADPHRPRCAPKSTVPVSVTGLSGGPA
jgi:hypothetical protein